MHTSHKRKAVIKISSNEKERQLKTDQSIYLRRECVWSCNSDGSPKQITRKAWISGGW